MALEWHIGMQHAAKAKVNAHQPSPTPSSSVRHTHSKAQGSTRAKRANDPQRRASSPIHFGPNLKILPLVVQSLLSSPYSATLLNLDSGNPQNWILNPPPPSSQLSVIPTPNIHNLI